MAAENSNGRHSARLTVAKTEAGDRVDIKELSTSSIPRHHRAACFCLACNRPLVARLGAKKIHHFAHKPVAGEPCWATSPEGATHLSAKRAVEIVLQQACAQSGTVTARAICPSCGELGAAAEVVQLSPTHQVLIEAWGHPNKSFKPDVQVINGAGERSLFIEVRVTHASSDEKVEYVRRTGVPLLEVDGQTILAELRRADFNCVMHVNVPALSSCATCADAEDRRRLEEQRRRAIEEHRQAAARTYEEYERRKLEVRQEAEHRVQERMRDLGATVVSWCHLRTFRGDACVGSATLEVAVDWGSEPATLELRHCETGTVIKKWAGPMDQLDRVYSTDLVAASKGFALAGSEGASVESFSGFRSAGYETQPPIHERVLYRETWCTVYPFETLARRFSIEGLFEGITADQISWLAGQHRWSVVTGAAGRRAVEARGLDRFIHRYRQPPLIYQRWLSEVEDEVRALLNPNARAPTQNAEPKARVETDVERQLRLMQWQALFGEVRTAIAVGDEINARTPRPRKRIVRRW